MKDDIKITFGWMPVFITLCSYVSNMFVAAIAISMSIYSAVAFGVAVHFLMNATCRKDDDTELPDDDR